MECEAEVMDVCSDLEEDLVDECVFEALLLLACAEEGVDCTTFESECEDDDQNVD
jgi:hypothetical protein